jgi:hypothetical protein
MKGRLAGMKANKVISKKHGRRSGAWIRSPAWAQPGRRVIVAKAA